MGQAGLSLRNHEIHPIGFLLYQFTGKYTMVFLLKSCENRRQAGWIRPMAETPRCPVGQQDVFLSGFLFMESDPTGMGQMCIRDRNSPGHDAHIRHVERGIAGPELEVEHIHHIAQP